MTDRFTFVLFCMAVSYQRKATLDDVVYLDCFTLCYAFPSFDVVPYFPL